MNLYCRIKLKEGIKLKTFPNCKGIRVKTLLYLHSIYIYLTIYSYEKNLSDLFHIPYTAKIYNTIIARVYQSKRHISYENAMIKTIVIQYERETISKSFLVHTVPQWSLSLHFRRQLLIKISRIPLVIFSTDTDNIRPLHFVF